MIHNNQILITYVQPIWFLIISYKINFIYPRSKFFYTLKPILKGAPNSCMLSLNSYFLDVSIDPSYHFLFSPNRSRLTTQVTIKSLENLYYFYYYLLIFFIQPENYEYNFVSEEFFWRLTEAYQIVSLISALS